MKVYILTGYNDHIGDTCILGVFSTKEKAEKEKEWCETHWCHDYYDLQIEEEDVQ